MILANISPGSANYLRRTDAARRPQRLVPVEMGRQGQVVDHRDALPGAAQCLAAGDDAPGAHDVPQVQGRADQRLRRHGHFRRLERRGPRRRAAAAANRVSVLIQGPDIEQLQIYVTDLMARLRTIPGLVDIDTNFEPTQQELRVNVDRARAADLGVAIDSLASSLGLLVGGNEVSKYKEGDDQFSVKLRLDEQFRNDPKRMGNSSSLRPWERSR